MRPTLIFAGTLLLVFFAGVLVIALIFDHDEVPKIAGSAFGAILSGATAFLIFYLSRARDAEKAEADQLKLEKAYWLDTWTMLPDVYDELLYWQECAGQETNPDGLRRQPRSLDLIVEHLHSSFFDANLASVMRLRMEAHTSLVSFHDFLRVGRERVKQLAPLLVELEARMPNTSDKSLSASFEDPWIRDRLINVAELSKGLADILDGALTYGWRGQEKLQANRGWQEEFVSLDRTQPPDIDWIADIKALQERSSRPLQTRT